MGGDVVTSIDVDMTMDISISRVEGREVMVVMARVGTTSQTVLVVLKVLAGTRVITRMLVIDIDLKQLRRLFWRAAMPFDMSSTRSGRKSLYKHGWPIAGSKRSPALLSN